MALGALAAWAPGAPERALARRERAWGTRIRAGDLVFQDLACGLRCDLIRAVTSSPYSHVGIVLEENGERVVWEALGPVGPTPLAEWIERGRGQRVAVYRPRAPLLADLNAVAAEVRRMRGLPYDGDYQWDDDRIYCSELVAKAFERASGRVWFSPRPLGPGSFGPHRATIHRMSRGRLTETTPLVAPVDLIRSAHLEPIVDELRGEATSPAGLPSPGPRPDWRRSPPATAWGSSPR